MARTYGSCRLGLGGTCSPARLWPSPPRFCGSRSCCTEWALANGPNSGDLPERLGPGHIEWRWRSCSCARQRRGGELDQRTKRERSIRTHGLIWFCGSREGNGRTGRRDGKWGRIDKKKLAMETRWRERKRAEEDSDSVGRRFF